MAAQYASSAGSHARPCTVGDARAMADIEELGVDRQLNRQQLDTERDDAGT
jgi:hypothetical protein